MKTFTAEQFNKAPREIYKAAALDGEVIITHDRYEDRGLEFKVVPVKKEEVPYELIARPRIGDLIEWEEKWLVVKKIVHPQSLFLEEVAEDQVETYKTVGLKPWDAAELKGFILHLPYSIAYLRGEGPANEEGPSAAEADTARDMIFWNKLKAKADEEPANDGD